MFWQKKTSLFICSKMSNTKWGKLSSCDEIHDNSDIDPIVLKNRKSFFVIIGVHIYKYNLQCNQFDYVMRINYTFGLRHSSVALDVDKQQLYSCDSRRNGLIHTVDLIKKSIINTDASMTFVGEESEAIMINGQFNVIGGLNNNKHLRWNSISKQFETIYKFDEFTRFSPGCLVYIKSQKTVLMFGCYVWSKKYFDDIYEYKIEHSKWYKLPIKLPKKYWTECINVIQNKFVLLLGGYNDSDGYHDDIFIFSIKDRTFKKSTIKCPRESTYASVVMNDQKRDEKIVFGFVRKQWKVSKISDHCFPPLYLIKLMNAYYLNEFIHLLDKQDGSHWKISTLDIVP
eukprot:477202_1